MLEYSDVGYQVLLNNKIVVVRDVDVVEEDTTCICVEDEVTNLEVKYKDYSESESEESYDNRESKQKEEES